MIFKIYRIDKDVWTKKDSTTEPFSKCGRDAVNHTFTSSLIYYSLSSGIWISYEATSSSVCQMPSGPPWIASGFNKAADEGRIFDEEKFSSELLCGLMDVSTWIMQCHWHVMPNKTTQKSASEPAKQCPLKCTERKNALRLLDGNCQHEGAPEETFFYLSPVDLCVRSCLSNPFTESIYQVSCIL